MSSDVHFGVREKQRKREGKREERKARVHARSIAFVATKAFCVSLETEPQLLQEHLLALKEDLVALVEFVL